MNRLLLNVGLVIALVAAINLGGCNYRNIDNIKANAVQTWEQNGFEVIGYEGYSIGNVLGNPGGQVWYIVQRKGNPNVSYHGYISKWGNEYHIYSLTAIDAIASRNRN